MARPRAQTSITGKIIICFLILFPLIMLVCLFVEHRIAALVFGALGIGFPTVLAAFGAQKNGSLGPLKWPLTGLFALQEVCFFLMIYFEHRVLDGPWLGSLPYGAAIELYVLWLGPLIIVPLAYALTFDSFSLRSQDIEHLKKLKQIEPPLYIGKKL